MAGYSSTPLQKKLGIKSGKAFVINEPTIYWELIAPLPKDFTQNRIREFSLKNGLVDVKVCAVDEIWSGLKSVFRLVDR